jgi:hypothetical protein
LDSTRSEGKEYSRLRKVLDDALNGYNVKLGNNAVSKKMTKGNMSVSFGDKTDFVVCINQKAAAGMPTTSSFTSWSMHGLVTPSRRQLMSSTGAKEWL